MKTYKECFREVLYNAFKDPQAVLLSPLLAYTISRKATAKYLTENRKELNCLSTCDDLNQILTQLNKER